MNANGLIALSLWHHLAWSRAHICVDMDRKYGEGEGRKGGPKEVTEPAVENSTQRPYSAKSKDETVVLFADYLKLLPMCLCSVTRLCVFGTTKLTGFGFLSSVPKKAVRVFVSLIFLSVHGHLVIGGADGRAPIDNLATLRGMYALALGNCHPI